MRPKANLRHPQRTNEAVEAQREIAMMNRLWRDLAKRLKAAPDLPVGTGASATRYGLGVDLQRAVMAARGKGICAVAAAVATLSVPVHGFAQELWNGARLGMTPADVRKAFPKAAQGQSLVDGDDVILRVPDLRAGGHDATGGTQVDA